MTTVVSPTPTPPITSPRKWRPRYMRERAIAAIHTAANTHRRRFEPISIASPTAKVVAALTWPDGNPWLSSTWVGVSASRFRSDAAYIDSA